MDVLGRAARGGMFSRSFKSSLVFILLSAFIPATAFAAADAPEALRYNALPERTDTGDCTTSLLAGTNFSSQSSAEVFYGDVTAIDYIEGGTGAVALNQALVYQESNGAFHEDESAWNYVIVSNPRVLREEYTAKSDYVNRLIVAPGSNPNGAEYSVFSYTVNGLLPGSSARVTFDIERLNPATDNTVLWEYVIRATSGNAYGPYFYDKTKIANSGTIDLTFDNLLTGTLEISVYARHTQTYEAVAFSDIRVYGCLETGIDISGGTNTVCEGSVLTLTAKGMSGGTYAWERRSGDAGEWIAMEGTSESIEASIDLGTNYFRVTCGGTTETIKIEGNVCCSGTAGHDVKFKQDFGTVTERSRDAIVDAIGAYSFAAEGKVDDDMYCVVSNIDQADPASCGWPGDKTDHTGNENGAYLIINSGATTAMFYEVSLGSDFCADTYYTMSLWAANVSTSEFAPAEFMFEVVEKASGTVLNQWYTGAIDGYSEEGKPLPWKRYGFSFYPSGGSELLLRIYSTSDEIQGNDFAIDDILVTTCSPDVTLYADYVNNQIDAVNDCGSEATLNAISVGDISRIFAAPYYYYQYSADGGQSWSLLAEGESLDEAGLVSQFGSELQARVIVADAKATADKVVGGIEVDDCEVYVISNVAKLTCEGCVAPENLSLTLSETEWCEGALESLTLSASVGSGYIGYYAWSAYDDASGSWVEIGRRESSAASESFSLSEGIDGYSAFKFECGVDGCTAESEEAAVTIKQPVSSVALYPESESVSPGAQVVKTLEVLPSDAEYSVVWFANGEPIDPAAYFPATISSDSRYSVAVLDECGNSFEAEAIANAAWATIITPYDGDGINDDFMTDSNEEFELEIFGRSGSRVYAGRGGWPREEAVRNAPGVYFYVASFGDGRVKKGTVEIYK